MKSLRHIVLGWYLAFAAKIVLWRCRSTIIAIAGTVNKTFTKEAIEQVLQAKGHSTLSTTHTYNTDIGLPLSILGLESGYNSVSRWLNILPQVLVRIFSRKLPSILILELGISHPGDAKKLLRIITPDIVVITDITQRYRENFGDMKTLSSEYGYLLSVVPKRSFVALNYDTIIVRNLRDFLNARVYFFSLENNANTIDRLWFIRTYNKTLEGMEAEIVSPSQTETIHLSRFGRHHLNAFLIARIVSSNIKIL